MGQVYICYCLLKSRRQGNSVSQSLFNLQERLEAEIQPGMLYQAFVFGDREVQCRSFQCYPKGFRVEIDPRMDEIRPQDMLVLAWRLFEKEMRKKNADFRLIILADHPIEARESLSVVKDRIQELRKKELRVIFVKCSKEAGCGALQSLVDEEIEAV